MRQRKTIKIDDKEITLAELTVEEILEFQDGLSSDDDSIDSFLGMIKTLLPKITKDVTVEDLKKMAPSEIETLVEGFKEVNAPFLRGAAWAGLGDLLAELRKAIMADFLKLLASSPKQAT